MGDLRVEYRFLSQQIASDGYHMISMDVRRHGETSTPWPDYSVGAIGKPGCAGLGAIISTTMAASGAESGCGSIETDGRPGAGLLLCAQQNSLSYSIQCSLFARRAPLSYIARALRANLEEPGHMAVLL